MERAQAIWLRSPESLTTHIQQGKKSSSCLKKMKACHFSFFWHINGKHISLPFSQKHCFQMNQPPLVTKQKNCRAKPTPKVSKQLFEKLLKFEDKWTYQAVRVVNNPPVNAGDLRDPYSYSLDQEDPLEKGLATHFTILAWRIHWTGEPGGLQSMTPRVRHVEATYHTVHTTYL